MDYLSGLSENLLFCFSGQSLEGVRVDMNGTLVIYRVGPSNKGAYRCSATNSIVLRTSQVVIEQVQKVKALGMYISSGLTNHANVSNIISKVNFRLSVLREVFKYAEYRTKIILMNSLVVSIFRYGCPLLIDSNAIIINKLQTLLMKCARQILGFKSYKMNTVNIMKEVKMLTVHHLIIKESIGFIHKIIFNENPKCIFKLLEYNSQESGNIRKVRKMRIKYDIIYEKVRQSLLYRSLFLLNTLEYDLRSMNPKKLSQYLKENIIYIFANNKIPKNETK